MRAYPIRFNKQEWAGSFGDIGTDLPLVAALILAADLHAPSVLIVFGLMQIVTGWVYRMPMPVQPLKAMATIVITQKIAGPVLLGAGLAIGVIMLVLSVTGVLDILSRVIPKAVVRGIQFGLGLSLCALAFREYISADGIWGYVLALAAFTIIVGFMGNRRFPASLLAIGLGVVYAFLFKVDFSALVQSAGINVPGFSLPGKDDVLKGLLLLALPQIPLSLGNSIMATKQVKDDFFPDRKNLTVAKIGLTYSLMNLTAPFLGGVPVCHGAGGMVGHYTFGGRTGGSVIIYGLLFMCMGLFFGNSFHEFIKVFPLPVLGTILFFEGLSLMLLVKDTITERRSFTIAIMVGLMAFGLPFGFAVALVAGTVLWYLPVRLSTLWKQGSGEEKDD